MPKALQQEDFAKHLGNIQTAKAQARQIMEINIPGYSKAEATLCMAWEVLFDHFCQCPKKHFDIEELDTFSTIIHKLMNAFQQMAKVEISLKQLRIQEAIFEQKSSQLQSLPSDQHAAYTFTEDQIQSFEKQFHLL